MAHISGYSDLIGEYYQVWFILIGLLAAAHKSGKEARKAMNLILLHVVLFFYVTVIENPCKVSQIPILSEAIKFQISSSRLSQF